MEHRQLTAAEKKKVVNAYRAGTKLHVIEEQFGIPRATVYWVLEQAEVAPDRVKRGSRLRGNDQQLAALYDLIAMQDKRIQELERELSKLKGRG